MNEVILINPLGQTVKDSINEHIKKISLWFVNDEIGKPYIYELRGKVNCAFEFGLITEEEWSGYINKIFILENMR